MAKIVNNYVHKDVESILASNIKIKLSDNLQVMGVVNDISSYFAFLDIHFPI